MPWFNKLPLHERIQMTKKYRIAKVCEFCGKSFEIIPSRAKAGRGRFCSKECCVAGNVGTNNPLWRNGGTAEYHCEICGKVIYNKPSHTIRFCSQECRSRWQSTMTGEIAFHWKGGGAECICEWCGVEFVTRQARARDEKRGRYCSKECKYAARRIEPTPYPREFNEELKVLIRKRDRFQCMLCGKQEPKLQVHHIDYDKANLRPSNLITLCVSCHCRTNSKRKHWKAILSDMMSKRACQ